MLRRPWECETWKFGFIKRPNRSAKITDHLTCVPVNIIYCITCTLSEKTDLGKAGRWLVDRFRENLRDVSKQVACHFNFNNHFHYNMTTCGLTLRHGNTESHKKFEKKVHFLTRYTLSTQNQWTPPIPLIYSKIHVTAFPPMPKLFHVLIKTNNNPQVLCSLWRRANARNVSFPNLSQW